MIETTEWSYEVELDELLGGIVKVKLSLCLIKHHARKTSAIYAGEWSILGPGHFTRREKHPGTHWIGLDGWTPNLVKTDR